MADSSERENELEQRIETLEGMIAEMSRALGGMMEQHARLIETLGHNTGSVAQLMAMNAKLSDRLDALEARQPAMVH